MLKPKIQISGGFDLMNDKEEGRTMNFEIQIEVD